jgi:hypothetical protein
MFHYNNICEPTSEPYATPLKYQDDDGYFWSFGKKVYYKDLKQILIDSIGKPPFGWESKQMRKIFYTTCSFILLHLSLQFDLSIIPKTFQIKFNEEVKFRNMIYKDLKHLITEDYISINFKSNN